VKDSALRPTAPLVLAAALCAAPRVAAACSVCMAASSDSTRLAFLMTAAFLSVTPLLMVGGILWWVVRRARAAEQLTRTGRARPVGAALTTQASAEF
jgi:BioD-like phosphotransacetylase family protein